MSTKLSRRGFIGGLGAGIASAMAFDGMRPRLFSSARAQSVNEKSTLVVLWLDGGHNGIFGSADSFLQNGAFSVTSSNIQDIGGGIFVDKGTFGTLPQVALSNFASIGCRHGVTDHAPAQKTMWFQSGNRIYSNMLASAMGGTGALKSVVLGYDTFSFPGDFDLRNAQSEGGVSTQRVSSMGGVIAALGAAPPDPSLPDRAIASKGMAQAAKMSAARLVGNPLSLKTVPDAYASAGAALAKAPPPFSYSECAAAYGFTASSQLETDTVAKQIMGAELMVRSDANVIMLNTSLMAKSPLGGINGWDHHGDVTGSWQRERMTNMVMPALRTFCSRMLGLPDRNVVIAVMSEFSRSLSDSGHASALSAQVMGKYVKLGTTGRLSPTVTLAPGSPGVPQLWAYLAKVLKVPGEPFGANPHALVL